MANGGLCSSGRAVQRELVIPFSENFLEFSRFTHAYAFSGITHFLCTKGDTSHRPISLLRVCGRARMCMRVFECIYLQTKIHG